ERLDKHGSRLYKLENLDIPHQVSKAVDEIVTDAVDWAIQAPLKDRFRDLPEADMKEILHYRIWESNSYKAHEDHKKLFEALEKSMDRDQTDQLLTDLAKARDQSISKMKAAYYPDVGLEQMVPDQMWIKEECKYDIAAMYGISHWWFQRQRFYIDRHTSECIEVFSLYGYDYMKKIVLRHLNHLPPKDKKILTTAVNLWTKNLVIKQCIEDFQLGIESYQTQLNLTKPQWDATSFEYKHDFTIIESPRAVIFRDKYGVQMIMRFNEIHKFSDGTLQ
ncbi:hypothetical protein Tco_1567863, partial [Tanacetum coccineum]